MTAPVVDPLEALARLEEMARNAQDQIRSGGAVNGMGALRKIEVEAQDARRWGGPVDGAHA